jgi:DNA invertase Pin-like site-specific DNA recombinase
MFEAHGHACDVEKLIGSALRYGKASNNEIFVDNSRRERPGGEVLTTAVATGEVRHVVAFKLDRLFRDAEDALRQTKAWDRLGVALHLVDMGGQTLNTATAMGRFFLNMMAGFAELERNLIAERTEAAMAHKKAHREVYSPLPYGFDREGDRLVANDREQAILRRIRIWHAEGWSLWHIARELNRLGVPTKQEEHWYASTVQYLLTNDLYTSEEAYTTDYAL